jgi:hypothetical protein
VANANYQKGKEKLMPKKVEEAMDNKAVEKLKAKERRVGSSASLKRMELKSKAESNSHKEHEKQPQPRWK